MDVTASLKRAAKTVAKALESPEPGPQDLLKTLKKEHDEVKSLLSALEDANSGARRTALVKQIKQALVPHTKAEQTVLYNAIIALSDKDAQVDGYEGYLEHALASKTLQKLQSMPDATSSEHRATAKVLRELVTHHIHDEESNLWSDAKKHFPKARRMRMNTAYLAAKAKVKLT